MPEDSPLTEGELADIKRLFSNPLFIPPNFKTWMGDQLALSIPDIPLGSLFGGRGIQRTLGVATMSVAASGAGVTTLYSKKIQAGSLGANGRLRFIAEFTQSSPDVSNDSFIDLVFGGTTVCTITDHTTGTAQRHIVVEGEVYNANSPSVQYGYMDALRLTDGSGPANTARKNANGSAAVDTTVDQTFELQGRWTAGSADDVLTLTFINLEIFNPIPFAS